DTGEDGERHGGRLEAGRQEAREIGNDHLRLLGDDACCLSRRGAGGIERRAARQGGGGCGAADAEVGAGGLERHTAASRLETAFSYTEQCYAQGRPEDGAMISAIGK